MGNNGYIKKLCIKMAVLLGALFVVLILINRFAYKSYMNVYNERVNTLCVALSEKYPEINEAMVYELLNSEKEIQENFFRMHSINLESDSVISQNKETYAHICFYSLFAATLFFIVILFSAIRDEKKRRKEIEEITRYMNQINKGNYQLNIDNNSEDDLSILKNEVYKSTVMLKESAENSINDKLMLKDFLSDISHQLKTPLTSLTINLDNLDSIITEEEIEDDYRLKCLSNARRDIDNINLLVQSLLKLSRLDADVVEFKKEKTDLLVLVKDSAENVYSLADLLGIKLTIDESVDGECELDAFWQREAITNLLKNAIEHAKERVGVSLEINRLYSQVKIENDGDAIDREDMLHIFERFYQGKNPSKGSVGIGLALAKSIVEKDGGYISVDSVTTSEGGKTVFTVRYPVM